MMLKDTDEAITNRMVDFLRAVARGEEIAPTQIAVVEADAVTVLKCQLEGEVPDEALLEATKVLAHTCILSGVWGEMPTCEQVVDCAANFILRNHLDLGHVDVDVYVRVTEGRVTCASRICRFSECYDSSYQPVRQDDRDVHYIPADING